MSIALAVILVCLIGVLTIVAYTSRLYNEAGKFLSREFQENIEAFEHQVEPRLGVTRHRAALSMALLEQLCAAAIAFIFAYSVFSHPWERHDVVEAAILLTITIMVFQRFIPYLLFARTDGNWIVDLTWLLRIFIYAVMPLTLVLGFMQSVVSLSRAENAGEEPEHPSEAVDALIEAGQDEGILEERDRDLIHSVVEFGDKTVREVMTPRPRIVAVPIETTIEKLMQLLNEHTHSRIPVYDGDIDHIVGIVHVRDLLKVADSEAHTRTVRELMNSDVYFVPETKRASELLQEMQRENIRMAVVIDEYGGVAGVVTTEDLVEEIVGELRDEREAKSDIVSEGENSYIVPGNLDVDHLDELFDIHVDGWEATTVGGLVTEMAGHIPLPGEVVEQEGLRFEVLDSTSRRVERVRVSAVAPPEQTTARNGQSP